LDLTYSFVWIIIISNMITVAICFLFLKPLAKVTQVRGAIIIPIILILIYLGAFAEKNAFEDMVIVLAFGALGWIMEKLEWPRPPVLLGLVLGPLAENRLFLSTDNYGLAWTHRPGVIGIFILTLFGIFYPIFKDRRAAKEKAAAGGAAAAVVDEPTQAGIKLTPAVWFTIVVIGLLAIALWQSRNFGYRAGLFPWVIGIPTLILACAQLGRDLYGKKKKKVAEDYGQAMDAEIAPEDVQQRTISIIIWTVGFFLAIWFFGFSIAVPLTIFLYLKVAGNESWTMSVLVTFFSWLFYWSLFEKLLNVPFPDGLLISLFRGGA